MRTKPNRSIIQGQVDRVTACPDGWGAEVTLRVKECHAAEGYDDFVQARPGSNLVLFASDLQGIQKGHSYRLTAQVLGGANGERVVLERVEDPLGQ